MKIIFGALFITVSLLMNAQNADLLIGKWKYYEVNKKKKLDETAQKMIEELFGDMTLYFNKNGLYKMFLRGVDEDGKWLFNEGNSVINLASNTGRNRVIVITDFTETKLMIKFNNHSFVLIPTAISAEDKQIGTPLEIVKVSVTIEQICKLWYLQRKEVPGQTEEQINRIGQIVKGSFFNLKKNGKYNMELLGAKEKGKWAFGEDQKSIIATKNKRSKTWNINYISDTELKLKKGISNETFVFSVNE